MFEIHFQYLYIVGLMFVLILGAGSYESINGLDYVKVEEEEAPQPLPHSREISYYADDNVSTEDYDDIGKNSEDGEDYDDVG